MITVMAGGAVSNATGHYSEKTEKRGGKDMQVNDNNFIMVSGWMRTRLGLKGNELMLFAMIYGFCQDGNNSYKCSIKYIQDWLGCARQTAVSVIKSLEEKGLIVKSKNKAVNNGDIANEYTIDSVKLEEYQEGGSKNWTPVSNFSSKGVQKLDPPSLKIRPHNNNIYNNIKTTSQPMRARVREGSDFFTELSKNQQMMEAACMNLKITPKIFKERLQEFENECKAKDTQHDDLNDYRRHFYDWLRIQVKNDISRESQAARGRSPYDYVPDYKIL